MILAQHKSEKEGGKMEAVAAQCVAQAPANHSHYTHTVNKRTYTFLMDPPFVFFAISHHSLLKSQTLPFLHRIRSSFHQTLPSNHHFAPLSFQPHFHSIINDALNDHNHNHNHNHASSSPSQGLKKKKRSNDSPAATLDVSDDVVSLPPLKPQPLLLPLDRHNKAKHVWKKHVWVLLLLDLFVCAVLFVIWLWVCSGFKCMAYSSN